MLMIFTPITISGIDSMHTVFTEIGENASIQRQLITPLTARTKSEPTDAPVDSGHKAMRTRLPDGAEQPAPRLPGSKRIAYIDAPFDVDHAPEHLPRTTARGPGAFNGRQEGFCSLARFLLAVNAPPSGRPALRSRNSAPAARICLKRGRGPRTPGPA